MTLSKNTVISVSLGTIFAVLSGLWFTVAKVQGAFDQLSVNTQAIESIGLAMELRGIDRIIESKSKEIRDKEIDILNANGNPALIQLLNTQVKELGQEIEMQKIIRECVVDPTKKVCK